jgi:hypothetical protein
MQEFGIPPLKLQQAMQLVSMYFRYSVTHTHLPTAHRYHLRRALMCALSQPQNSIESRIKEACNELRLPETYPDHPPYPPQCSEPKSEIKASPTPLGSNPRSTTYGTSSSAPQSQHMLVRSTAQTFPSVQRQGLPQGLSRCLCGEGGSPKACHEVGAVTYSAAGDKLPLPPDTLAFHSAEKLICECILIGGYVKWCARSVEGGCRFLLAY